MNFSTIKLYASIPMLLSNEEKDCGYGFTRTRSKCVHENFVL